MRFMARSSVDLPQPEAPINAVMRPRVYGADSAAAFAEYASVYEELGFESFGSLEMEAAKHGLVLLDMGPGSVDGWLAGLVAHELGIERADLLEVDARELVLDGHRVSLTQLEFGVMRYLVDHEGKVASRIALESEVWGDDYHGGSNVVDVLVKSLRKKLGDQSPMIETVHGKGVPFAEVTPRYSFASRAGTRGLFALDFDSVDEKVSE
jgi:hypothetical protein